MTLLNDPLAFAKSYPFPSPAHSFIYRAEGEEAIRSINQLDAVTSGRTPVLAYGSNCAPVQLKRKFHDHLKGCGGSIPVIKAAVKDTDVVYSPIIVPYGSVPATITPSSGTVSHVFITYLTDDQLDIMHRSEAAGLMYDYLPFDPSLVTTPFPSLPVEGLHTYRSMSGVFHIDGNPVALADVKADHRRFSAKNQVEMLTLIKDSCSSERSLDSFVQKLLEHPAFREQINHDISGLFGEPTV